MIPRALLVLIVLILTCAAVGACGGDDDDEGDPLSSYLTQLSAIASLGNTQIEGLSERYPTAFEDVQVTKDYYAEYVESYSRFLDATKQLPTPDEVSTQHAEYVASSEAVLQGNQARLAELESATSIEEVNAIFGEDPEYTAAVARQDAACQALKDIATANDVNAPGLGDCNNFN